MANNYTVMHTKSPLYVLDKWDQTCVAGKTSKAGTAVKTSAAVKTSDAKKVKADAKTLTGSTLLSKGPAAAAKYINTFGKIKQEYEEDM